MGNGITGTVAEGHGFFACRCRAALREPPDFQRTLSGAFYLMGQGVSNLLRGLNGAGEAP